MTKMEEAKAYKKYLRGMRRATSSQFPANAFTAGKTALGKAQLKSHLKTKLPKEASTLKKAAQVAKATRYGKIALGVAGAGLAAREWLKHKSKQHKAKKKKHSVGALVIGLGAKKMKDKGKNVLPLGGAAALLLGKKKKEMLGRRLGGGTELDKLAIKNTQQKIDKTYKDLAKKEQKFKSQSRKAPDFGSVTTRRNGSYRCKKPP